MRIAGVGLLALLLALPGASSFAQDVRKSGNAESAVATVGDLTLSEESFRAAVGNRLVALEAQLYRARRQILDGMIAGKLLEKAARDAGTSVEEYTTRAMSRYVTPVTDEQVRAVFENSRSRSAGIHDGEALTAIRISLEQSRVARARQAVIDDLRARQSIRVLLAPPRVEVPPSLGVADGPADAAVRVVVFADFQCPFCGQHSRTLRDLKAQFGERIRLEFRHFPLPIHKDAELAAEAAACMGIQGRFWEMHDLLYANQKQLAHADLLAYAARANGDTSAFRGCLDRGETAKQVAEDKKVGDGLGVSATPATFINGRLVPGATPVQELVQAVEEELALPRQGERPSPLVRR